jgi:hypothetical protein
VNEIESPALHFIRTVEDPKKGRFRFAAIGPKGHSATWTAFGRGNEYYVGARPLMGSMKVSLHGSGVCRVALTEKHYQALPLEGLSQPADRAFLKWKRAEIPLKGAVHVASIVFPSDHLVLPQPAGSSGKPVVIFGDAPLGNAVEVGFFFSREDLINMEDRFLRIGKPILGTTLEDGTVVSVVVREIEFDASVLPQQEKLNNAACTVLSRELHQIEHEQGDFTGLFWTKPADGQTFFLYEIGGVALRRRQ